MSARVPDFRALALLAIRTDDPTRCRSSQATNGPLGGAGLDCPKRPGRVRLRGARFWQPRHNTLQFAGEVAGQVK